MSTHPTLWAASAAVDRPGFESPSRTRRDRAVADDARRRREALALHAHALVFAAGMIVMFSVNLVVNLSAGIVGQWSAWWAVWALLGWGIGLTIHALVVQLARLGDAASSDDSASEAVR